LQRFLPQWVAPQLSEGKTWERGPECKLSDSEMMTSVVLHHSARYRCFKNFYRKAWRWIFCDANSPACRLTTASSRSSIVFSRRG
jgi:hypothetical protein